MESSVVQFLCVTVLLNYTYAKTDRVYAWKLVNVHPVLANVHPVGFGICVV